MNEIIATVSTPWIWKQSVLVAIYYFESIGNLLSGSKFKKITQKRVKEAESILQEPSQIHTHIILGIPDLCRFDIHCNNINK